MCQVSIKIPDAVMYDTKMNQNDVEKFIRRLVAVEYYKSKGISIGYCAEIAGMNETDFIKYLGDNKISIIEKEDKAKQQIIQNLYWIKVLEVQNTENRRMYY